MELILKVAREKHQITYKSKPMRESTDFPNKNTEHLEDLTSCPEKKKTKTASQA
jgi:hypothetical protein